MLRDFLDTISPRLTEPSTWIGVITLAGTVLGWTVPPALAASMSIALSGLAGVALILVRERRTPEQPK